jgi:RNA polymerase sigma-70 factor (ECF subfamily)
VDDHAADLALARAAAAGDAAAIRAVDDLLGEVAPAVRRIDASAGFVDEVRQALRVRLLVGEGGEPPRIAGYGGRGPLRAWLRIAAVRTALNLKRPARRETSAEEVLGELVARDADPELAHLKTLYRAELRDALGAALAALPDRDRAVLRLHYVDGMRLARIAALYQVQESTVSRWVHKAAEAVGAAGRRQLRGRLSLSASALDSVARLVESNLDLSLARILD